MRNIGNIFETRPIEVLDPATKEPILRFRTLQKGLDYLKIKGSRDYAGNSINIEKVVFSKKLNKGILLKDYKEKWLSQQNMIFLKATESAK